MKSKITELSTKEDKLILHKKIKKLQKQLNTLYPEYKYLTISKTNKNRLEYLINIISKTEYKYINYLKKKI